MARSEYLLRGEVRHVLAALMEPNRLACEVCLRTGLRIGDVLQLRREQLTNGNRCTVQEEKTGKNRRIFIADDLRDRLLAQAGKIYVFPHRTDGRKHRTRQAVYKDLKRAAKGFRVKVNLTPHSLRKVYAVEQLRQASGDLAKVQKLLNHSDPAVTMIYALADELTKRRGRGKIGGK